MRNIILFVLISIPLLLLIYSFSQPNNKPLEKVRIGIDQYPGFEYLFVAKKEGFFVDVGLDIELVELSSLVEVRRAFERGKIDGMASTLVEVLEAYKYSNRIAQVVLVTDFSDGADVILASPYIKSVSDLKGKIIAVESGSLSLYLVYRALELNNIKLSEAVIKPMERHEMLLALKSGKADAITSYPPASVTIQKQIVVNSIFDSSDISGEIMDVISIDKSFLEKSPELQNKFREVWKKTLEFIASNPEKAFTTLVERFPISIDEFKQSMHGIKLASYEDQISMLKNGGITQQTLNKIGQLVFKNSNNRLHDYSQFIYNVEIAN